MGAGPLQQPIRIEQVSVATLRPDPANPRRISDEELESLTRSIRQFGLVDPIIARREDKTVIGGHQRLVAARRLGMKTVPVVFMDVSAEQARLLNIGLNKISGSWDQELLARLLADLQAVPGVDLTLSGFSDDELHKLLRSLDARERRERVEQFDLDAALEEATRQPRAKRGDLWLLGEHRLLCGDSTDHSTRSRLMGDNRARMLLTDPPYGVDYETAGDNPRWRKRSRPIANDALGEDQGSFWTAAFRSWPVEGDVYVFSPSGPMMLRLQRAVEAAGIPQHQWLIWVKDRLVLGRSHYQYRHEHIFYGWREKTSWNGSRKEDSVWECPRPGASPEHPTMKPLPILERAIENSSQPGDVVLDQFLGSGSTLVACERTGRVCFGAELEPVYCDVAVRRWEAFTGRKARLAEESKG